MSLLRHSQVSVGRMIVDVWRIKLPLNRSLLLETKMGIDGKNRDIKLIQTDSEIAENLPDDYYVCPEGCDSFTDGEIKIPCGKCASEMVKVGKLK